MEYDRKKVIDIAKAEVEYLEKKNGNITYLYDKTANAEDKILRNTVTRCTNFTLKKWITQRTGAMRSLTGVSCRHMEFLARPAC